jgi:hypothetical protein
MLYATKCYWSGVTENQIAERAARAATPRSSDDGVAYLGSLLFCEDDVVLCLVEGRSRGAVKHASRRLSIPCERLMDSIWLDPNRRAVNGASQ